MTRDEGPPADEDRRKHLEFIQAVITRMSTASSNAKSWLLPVVTAAYGYALTQRADSVALLGIMAVVVFAFLDANYLRKEQEYRELYNAVARLNQPQEGARTVPLFSMNPGDALVGSKERAARGNRLTQALRCWTPGLSIWFSWSVLPFYGSLLVVGVAIFLRVQLGEP